MVVSSPMMKRRVASFPSSTLSACRAILREFSRTPSGSFKSGRRTGVNMLTVMSRVFRARRLLISRLANK